MASAREATQAFLTMLARESLGCFARARNDKASLLALNFHLKLSIFTMPNKSFLISLTTLLCSYLFFQFFYSHYATFSVDEFWFSHWTHRYASGLPYRDFLPYKTVLGYYLLLLPLSLSSHYFMPLLITKNVIALANTFLFFIAAIKLKKFFPKQAIITSIALLISTEFILTYSSQIRVDFFAYWFCLFSALCLLEKRVVLAGILLALGFLISQKTLWYVASSNIALGITWFFLNRNRKTMYSIFIFNLSLFVIIGVYILFWSALSSVSTVLHSMFYEAYIMYQLEWYRPALYSFWQNTLILNPLPFLLWPIGCLSLMVTSEYDRAYPLRFFITLYASVIMICLIPYQQFFPYYRLTVLPAFLLLYTAVFAWMFDLFNFKNNKILLKPLWLWLYCFIYSACLIYIIFYFVLPKINLLIIFIPILLCAFITIKAHKNYFSLFTLLIILITGLIYPVLFFIYQLPEKKGNYQKSMLQLSHQLLKDNSDYLAGIELFYDKNQPIPGMKHLDGPAIAYLYSPTEKLRKAMLSSLYHTPDITAEKAIELLKKSRIKLYVNNYRIHALPPEIKNYLHSEYQHFWGSVYLYAPIVTSHHTQIKFSGKYKIESNQSVRLDHKKILPHSVIFLTQGNHTIFAEKPFRLVFIPEGVEEYLHPEFKTDQWLKMLN